MFLDASKVNTRLRSLPIHIYGLSLLALMSLVSIGGCDRTLSLRLDRTALPSLNDFDVQPGYKLPYPLYMPSSIMGWELSPFTEMLFDDATGVYQLAGIPLDLPEVDRRGTRFKICSDDWKNQFGFGDYLTDVESTVGLDLGGLVQRVVKADFATADIRIEYSTADREKLRKRMLSLEFKVTTLEPEPHGLIRLTIY